ncbi:MAG: 3-deoxy-D-manno-octulosonic acid transferase [Candidatus Krumholzibacteriia bacterium]
MLWLYNVLLVPVRTALRLATPWNRKLQAGMRGRRGAETRLRALGPELRGRVVWLHSTSVGEYEQARPIAALLGQRLPDLEILHTFFSPSGFDYATRLGEARHVEYLPEDSPGRIGRVLDELRPLALVFMKFDLWPNLIVQAERRGVPVLLLDATLHGRSLRSRWPARRLYRQLYRKLALISAVSEADAGRFRELVPEHPGIVVDGDTRFDQVMRRRREAHRVEIATALCDEPRPFTLIAGSTWDPDDARIVPAWRALCASWSAARRPRLVLVPHEPTPEHLAVVERRLRDARLPWTRYSWLESQSAASPHVVVVDRVGVLAELYARADAAYVGGAFTTGVHNLMEPAIMGLPVFFGPRHHNAPEAEGLLEARAASVIRCPADLERQLRRIASDAEERSRMGGRARAFVESNLGASRRCLQRIVDALESPAARAKERA